MNLINDLLSKFKEVLFTDKVEVADVDHVTIQVRLNPKVWNSLSKDQKVALLLHELGHIAIGTKDEVKAETWAMEQYKKLGLTASGFITLQNTLLNSNNKEHVERMEKSKKFFGTRSAYSGGLVITNATSSGRVDEVSYGFNLWRAQSPVENIKPVEKNAGELKRLSEMIEKNQTAKEAAEKAAEAAKEAADKAARAAEKITTAQATILPNEDEVLGFKKNILLVVAAIAAVALIVTVLLIKKD